MRISDWSSDVCSSDLAHEDISAPSQFGECLAWPGIPAENDYAAWSFEPVRKGLVPSRIERLIVCILRREYLDPAIRIYQPSLCDVVRLNGAGSRNREYRLLHINALRHTEIGRAHV